MSDDWKVGDLAVCVDVSPFRCQRTLHIGPKLAEGATVQVLGVGVRPCGCRVLLWPGTELGGVAHRFRKIHPDEHEACEDEFVTLLNRSKQPEKLPMVEALARFGDVPTSFVMREMEDARDSRELERDLKEWLEDLATRNFGDAETPKGGDL
jgi:hypothetical protein